MLHARFPDGSLRSLAKPVTFGRGNPPCLSDAFCSRLQFTFSPVSAPARPEASEALNKGPAVRVTAAGANAVVVERPAAGRTGSPSGQATWDMVGYLEKGSSTLVYNGYRLYVMERPTLTQLSIVLVTEPDGDGEVGEGVVDCREAKANKSSEDSTPLSSKEVVIDDSRIDKAVQPDNGTADLAGLAEQPGSDDDVICVEVGPPHKRIRGAEDKAQGGAKDMAQRGAVDLTQRSARDTVQGRPVDLIQRRATDMAQGGAVDLTQEGAEDKSQGVAVDLTHGVTGHESPCGAQGMVNREPSGFQGIVQEPGPSYVQQDQAQKLGASCVQQGTRGSSLPSPLQAPFSLLRVRGLRAEDNAECLGASLSKLVDGGHGGIRLAVVSNYMVCMTWLLSACPELRNADELVVIHGEGAGAGGHGGRPKVMTDQELLIQSRAECAGMVTRFTQHAPPLPIPFGTHHSKFMLLKYNTGVRVIIHTANMIYADCNNKAQGLWYQDFPLKTGSLPPRPSDWSQANPHRPDFGRDLAAYLFHLHLPKAAAEKLQQLTWEHDFSSARAYLVASTPGYHTGSKMLLNGHMRLRTLLQKEALPSEFVGKPAQLVAQFSSFGSIDTKWLLEEFGASLATSSTTQHQPAPPASRADVRNRQAGKTQPSCPTAVSASHFHLVWPTLSQVKGSVEGWKAGYSLPGGAKNILKDEMQQFMCKYDGSCVRRGRVMPHMKTFTRFQGQQLAWVVVASHNLSKAAWGALQKKGSQLMVRSYELGTLSLPHLEQQYRQHRHYGFSCTPGPTSSTNQATSAPKPASASTGNATEWRPAGGTSLGRVQFWHMGQYTVHQASPTASTDSAAAMYLPLPYSLPPQRYTSRGASSAGAQQGARPLVGGDVDIPWCGELPHMTQDCLGQYYGEPAEYYNKLEARWE